jgi:hypothetical protein
MARTGKATPRMKAYTKERMALKRLNKRYDAMTKEDQKAYDRRFALNLAEKQAIHQLKVEVRRAEKAGVKVTSATFKLPQGDKPWSENDSKDFDDFLKLSEEEVAALTK